jgi:uncharacterized membrane protein YdbT with pleckstrin-like domain
MSYLTRILQPDEYILAIGRLHWIVYKDAAFALVLAAVLFWISARNPQVPPEIHMMMGVGIFVLLVSALCIGIKTWFDQWITEIAVTNRRVIYKHGFIRRSTDEMNMDKIESVTVTQSILGRILDYGSIHVRGTGVGIEHLHRIKAPIMLRNCITAR